MAGRNTDTDTDIDNSRYFNIPIPILKNIEKFRIPIPT